MLKTKNLYRFIRLLHGEISDGGTSERVKEQEESESRWPFGASPAFLEKEKRTNAGARESARTPPVGLSGRK